MTYGMFKDVWRAVFWFGSGVIVALTVVALFQIVGAG